jgi:hypothetical protein
MIRNITEHFFISKEPFFTYNRGIIHRYENKRWAIEGPIEAFYGKLLSTLNWQWKTY